MNFFFGGTCSILKFLGQGSNPSGRCNLFHSCSNGGSLTHHAAAGTPWTFFFFEGDKYYIFTVEIPDWCIAWVLKIFHGHIMSDSELWRIFVALSCIIPLLKYWVSWTWWKYIITYTTLFIFCSILMYLCKRITCNGCWLDNFSFVVIE